MVVLCSISEHPKEDRPSIRSGIRRKHPAFGSVESSRRCTEQPLAPVSAATRDESLAEAKDVAGAFVTEPGRSSRCSRAGTTMTLLPSSFISETSRSGWDNDSLEGGPCLVRKITYVRLRCRKFAGLQQVMTGFAPLRGLRRHRTSRQRPSLCSGPGYLGPEVFRGILRWSSRRF